MSRPKSKQKRLRHELAAARKRYAERKKQRIAELRAQSVGNAVEGAPAKRASVARKPASA